MLFLDAQGKWLFVLSYKCVGSEILYILMDGSISIFIFFNFVFESVPF